mgnify:FL=1
MNDLITVQGVVLSAMPIGEYDKRIVLLTRERGKISAFAQGARKLNCPYMAAANPFAFGTFTLREGKNSYNISQVSLKHHFVELAKMQPGVYYGYYFLEIADYFGREGTDELEMVNLLYVTARALLNPKLDDRLIRCVFELRSMAIQGMMPQVFSCLQCEKDAMEQRESFFFTQKGHGILCEDCLQKLSGDIRSGQNQDQDLLYEAVRITPSALYTLQYILQVPLEKLYSFTLTEEVLRETEGIVHSYIRRNTDRKFKSLQIL